jgi:PhzF family phenazine biosynthesis protein
VDAELLSRVLIALELVPSQVRASQWLDNGPKWMGLLLTDADTVLHIEPDHSALKVLANVGVVGAHANGDAQFEVRAFAAPMGVPEDSVTGSLNASLAQWLIGEAIAPASYVAAQGTRMDRSGRVHIQSDRDTIWVGGSSVTCIRGELCL